MMEEGDRETDSERETETDRDTKTHTVTQNAKKERINNRNNIKFY